MYGRGRYSGRIGGRSLGFDPLSSLARDLGRLLHDEEAAIGTHACDASECVRGGESGQHAHPRRVSAAREPKGHRARRGRSSGPLRMSRIRHSGRCAPSYSRSMCKINAYGTPRVCCMRSDGRFILLARAFLPPVAHRRFLRSRAAQMLRMGEECATFARGEWPSETRGEITQAQGAEPHADQPPDGVTKGSERAADLALASLAHCRDGGRSLRGVDRSARERRVPARYTRLRVRRQARGA